MSFVINIQGGGALTGVTPPSTAGRNSPGTRLDRAAPLEGEDTVELSPVGRQLASAMQTSSFRLARIRAIRAEIANGTYETPERLSGAVVRLLDVLG